MPKRELRCSNNPKQGRGTRERKRFRGDINWTLLKIEGRVWYSQLRAGRKQHHKESGNKDGSAEAIRKRFFWSSAVPYLSCHHFFPSRLLFLSMHVLYV